MSIRAANASSHLFSVGFFIDKMSDYGAGFLMAGVALLLSAMFLLLLHQMNRRGQLQRHADDDVYKQDGSKCHS